MAKKHTEEFRQEAVRIALMSGLTRRQVASDLGVGFSTLARWIQKSGESDDFPSTTDVDLAKRMNGYEKKTVFFWRNATS